MKKKLIIWMTIPLLFVGFVLVYWNYISQAIEWKMNWGFEAPVTSNIETVFNTRNGFPSEGETFHVLTYRSIEKKVKEKDGWILINEESFDTVSRHLNEFQKNTTSINKDTQNLKELFQEHPVTYDIKDQYFYKSEKDNSYILAISNAKAQKIFVMQWIQ